MKMKDYLNKEETNNFLLIGTLLDTVTGIKDDWKKRNMLTKEEHKYLALCKTYAEKFYNSVLLRLNPKEAEKIYKRLFKFDIKVLDEYTKKRLYGEFEKEYAVVKIPREEFEDWTEQIMEVECKNCNKHWSECRLHEIFQENFIPESGFNCSNCRYAYKETKVEKNIEKIKEFEEYKRSKRGA